MGNYEKIFDQFEHPVFLQNPADKKLYLNFAAQKEFNLLPKSISLEEFRKYFPFHRQGRSVKFCSYQNNIYQISEETISAEYGKYRKLSFSKVHQMLDPFLLEHYKLISAKFVHQFRSPLTSVTGYVDLISNTEHSEKNLLYLEKIEGALNESFKFLQQAERFAQPVEPEITTFPLDLFRKSVFNEFDKASQDRINLKIPEGDINVVSDFKLLATVLSELLKNALEATGEPVHLTFTETGSIHVQNPNTDLGEKDFERIFLPYYTTKALHLGLGLPTCQYICHKLGLPFNSYFSDKKKNILFQVLNIPFIKK